jgi:hypothetical protein
MPAMNLHWRKSTNESKGKPEQEFETAFETILELESVFNFQISKQKLYIEQNRLNNFKGLVSVANLFIYFLFFITCIPNHINTVQSSIFIRRGLSSFFSLLCSEGKPPWGAEPRFKLEPALQASALPSYAAP